MIDSVLFIIFVFLLLVFGAAAIKYMSYDKLDRYCIR